MDQVEAPLSAQARAILQLIAAGRSYDQILLHHPDLTYGDIFAAADEALAKLPATPTGADDTAHQPQASPAAATASEPDSLPDQSPARLPTFIERARQTHRRAWARWTPDEDAQMERLFRHGAHLAEIGQALGRHHGAIKQRLVKLGLVSNADDEPGLLLKPADAPPPRATGTWDGGWDVIRRRLEDPGEHD